MFSRSHRRLLTIWRQALVAAVCAAVAQPCAPLDAASEYDVKAAYLLNFTKFVDWPATAFATADSPLAICVLGNDPFGTVLNDLVQGEEVNGRKLVVRQLSQPPPPHACQVIFLHGGTKNTAHVVGELGAGVLSVGEGERFLRDGGAIAFVVDQRRVRFDINQSAAEGAGLKLSSKLLSVARTVEK